MEHHPKHLYIFNMVGREARLSITEVWDQFICKMQNFFWFARFVYLGLKKAIQPRKRHHDEFAFIFYAENNKYNRFMKRKIFLVQASKAPYG